MPAKMYKVFTVVERLRQDDFWLNIGTAFAHEKGDGFNVVLQALPLNGRLVLRAYDPSAQVAPVGETGDGKKNVD